MLSKKTKDATTSRKIVGAPNNRHILGRALAFGVAGLGLAVAAGCDQTLLLNSVDPEHQDIMYAGCHSVMAEETCELKEVQDENLPEISLAVSATALPKIHLETPEGNLDVFNSDTCEDDDCFATADGFRFTLSIPKRVITRTFQ